MNQDVKVCPYNAKHVHPAAEHQFHLVHCLDRTIIDREIIYGSGTQHFVSCLSPFCFQDNLSSL